MISYFLRNNMHLLAAEKHRSERPDVLQHWRAIVRLAQRICGLGMKKEPT